ncbi:MAG: hypothetical protein CFK52_06835 [Chloracidobacterium sp. CP2_5A]|nr:MAG: hypothetical protein CFK52_06835 [Chloracidobacterium sp. CP2_5A]
MTQPKRTDKPNEAADRQPIMLDPLAKAAQTAADAMLDAAAAMRGVAFAGLRASLAVQEEALKSAMTLIAGSDRTTAAASDAAREAVASSADAMRATLEQWSALVGDGLRKQMELMAFPVSQLVK